MSQSPELNPAIQPETVSQPPSLSTLTAWQDSGLLNLDWLEIIWRLQHNKIWKKWSVTFPCPVRSRTSSPQWNTRVYLIRLVNHCGLYISSLCSLSQQEGFWWHHKGWSYQGAHQPSSTTLPWHQSHPPRPQNCLWHTPAARTRPSFLIFHHLIWLIGKKSNWLILVMDLTLQVQFLQLF